MANLSAQDLGDSLIRKVNLLIARNIVVLIPKVGHCHLDASAEDTKAESYKASMQHIIARPLMPRPRQRMPFGNKAPLNNSHEQGNMGDVEQCVFAETGIAPALNRPKLLQDRVHSGQQQLKTSISPCTTGSACLSMQSSLHHKITIRIYPWAWLASSSHGVGHPTHANIFGIVL